MSIPRATDGFWPIYLREGVVSREPGSPLLLHESCPDRVKCWGSRLGEAEEAVWNQICLPYVGKYFGGGHRITALGLNYYRTGGLDTNQRLVGQAACALMKGQRKINFDNPGYAGTLYWHRLAAYLCAIVWRDSQPSPQRLGEVFDHVTYLEAVKCSPPWKVSRPTRKMRHTCPSRFLNAELGVLQPSILLKLGSSTRDGINRDPILKAIEREPFLAEQVKAAWGEVWILTVPHPSRPGGNAKSYIDDFCQFVCALELACDGGRST